MLDWMLVLLVVSITTNPEPDEEGIVEQLLLDYRVIQILENAIEVSGYQLERLMDAVKAENSHQEIPDGI